MLRHLERLGSGPRATYATLCGLLDAPEPLPAASMLLYHMVRELESALRAVMREAGSEQEENDPGPSAPEQRRQEILAMITGLELAPGGDGEQLREEILSALGELQLAPAGERQKEEIRAITAALGVEAEVAAAWIALAGKAQGWAHRRNLDAPEALDPEVRERLDQLEWVFDKVLDAHAARYAESVKERLAALLANESPTKQDAARLRTAFPQDLLTQQAFFTSADRTWLVPLQGARIFKNPPGLAEPGDPYGSFPWWPASDYLVRMAEQAQLDAELDAEQVKARTTDQAKILEIAAAIPASENPRIGMDLARIARFLTPQRAARLAGNLATALGNRYVIGAEHYAGAAAALAAGGQGAAAATVLRALLALGGGEAGTPSTRVGDREYGEVLRRCVPAVADAMGIEALKLLVGILTQATGPDNAQVWLRTVEGAQCDEHMFDPWAGLVASVRDCAVRLVQAGTPAEQVLACLPLEPAGVLARIHLHLLGLEPFATALPDQARAAMADPVLLHASVTEPEFLRLLDVRAGLLDEAERAELQAAIEAGPDIEEWRRVNPALRDEALPLLEARWRLERYAAASEILDESGRTALERMVEVYGTAPFQRPRTERRLDPSPPPGPAPTGAVAAVTTAPELAAALAAARDAAAAERDPMRTLNPMWALGTQLRDAVTARATAFSAEAGALTEIGEHLTGYALSGFAQAVRAGAVLDWAGLEPLMTTAAHARGTARCEAVRLVRTAVETKALPAEAAGWVWPILAAALNPDPDADPAHDAAHRAEVVHTVADFALWAHQAGYASDAAATLAGLDPAALADPVAVAVGEVTWTLFEVGHPAALERLAALTPGMAGFTGYLRSYHPGVERQMLGTFGQALAAAELSDADHQKIGLRLLRLYFAGVIGLQPGGLAERWWRHKRTTAEAVRDLASILAWSRLEAGQDGESFNAYLDWRLNALTPAPGTFVQGPARAEMMTLAPTCLRTAPAGQALTRLRRILATIGDLPAAPEMWQRLLEASRTEQATVLELLHAWSTYLTGASLAPGRRDEEINAIWRAGLDSHDPVLVELATRAINRAASAGFHGYLSLLQPSSGDDAAGE
jgi:hypothetical protein